MLTKQLKYSTFSGSFRSIIIYIVSSRMGRKFIKDRCMTKINQLGVCNWNPYRRVLMVAKSACNISEVRLDPSAHIYQRTFHRTDFRGIWYWGLSWKSVEIIQIWFKTGKNISNFKWKLKYIVLRPASLNGCTCARFHWSGIRLLRERAGTNIKWTRNFVNYLPFCIINKAMWSVSF
jgi:hypothetical protein